MSDFYFIIIYGVILIIILYLILSIIRPSSIETPTAVPVSVWWPWSITTYSWWPYWFGTNHIETSRHSNTHAPHMSTLDRPWGGAGRMANHGNK